MSLERSSSSPFHGSNTRSPQGIGSSLGNGGLSGRSTSLDKARGLKKRVSFSTQQLDEVLEEVHNDQLNSMVEDYRISENPEFSENGDQDVVENGFDMPDDCGIDNLFYPFGQDPLRPQNGTAFCSKGAPTPSNEQYRLRTLRSLDILDTPMEDRFDRITKLAAKTFKCAISLVSLVDEQRQWFKANYGLEEVPETPRNLAFCAYTLLPSRYPCLVVEDTLQDTRFSDHKLVQGEPYIRFYAGAPLLTSDGAILGSLCIIDNHPHKFSPVDEQLLMALSHLVVLEAEKKRRADEVARMKEESFDGSQNRFLLAVDKETEGLCLVDMEGGSQTIVYVNEGWEEVTGYTMEEALGKPCGPLLQGPDTDKKAVSRLREAIKQQTAVSVYILNYRKDGSSFWNLLRIKPVYAPTASRMPGAPARYWIGIISKANSIM